MSERPLRHAPMTIRLDWFHFCEYACMNASQRPGALGIFEGVIVDTLPARIPLAIVFQLRGVAPKKLVTVRLTMTQPAGTEAFAFTAAVAANDEGGAVFQLSLASAPFSEASRHVLAIVAEGQALPSQSIWICLVPSHSPSDRATH